MAAGRSPTGMATLWLSDSTAPLSHTSALPSASLSADVATSMRYAVWRVHGLSDAMTHPNVGWLLHITAVWQ